MFKHFTATGNSVDQKEDPKPTTIGDSKVQYDFPHVHIDVWNNIPSPLCIEETALTSVMLEICFFCIGAS